MKLAQVLTEQYYKTKPKAIIIAGASGSGKVQLLNKLALRGIETVNLDKYINSSNNKTNTNLKATTKQVGNEIESIVKSSKTFAWITTASNYDKIKELVSSGYSVLMVMIYVHPITSLISNMEQRTSRISTTGVLNTWKSTYQLIEKYKKLLGDNFIIFYNDKTKLYNKEITEFNSVLQKGVEEIKAYLIDLENNVKGLQKNPTLVQSYEIPTTAKKTWDQEMSSINYDTSDKALNRQLRKYWLQFYSKNKTGPGNKKIKEKIKSIYRRRDQDKDKQREVYQSIASMLNSSKFIKNLQHRDFEEIQAKIQRFL